MAVVDAIYAVQQLDAKARMDLKAVFAADETSLDALQVGSRTESSHDIITWIRSVLIRLD